MIAIVQATIKRKAEQEAAVPRGNMAPSQFDHSGYSNYTPVSTQGEDQHSIDNTSMPSPSSDSELINTPAASDDYGTKQDNIEHGSLALQTDPPPEYQVIKYCYGPKREYEYKAANGEVEPHMNGSITLMQRLRDARRARRMARRLERRRQRKFTKGTLFIAIVKFILLAGLVHLLFQDIFRSGKWVSWIRSLLCIQL